MKKKKNNHILIILEGGLVQNVLVPPGCTYSVEVHDYDKESVEVSELIKDGGGSRYFRRRFSPELTTKHPSEW